MRRSRFTVPLDTSLFTPIQLQTRFLMWLGMNAWSRWVLEHLVPFRTLIREHKMGFVVMSVDLEFLRPFGFFDADELVVDTGWRARLGGIILAGETIFTGGGEVVGTGHCTLRPVRLQDVQSLAAVPSRLSRTLLERFQPDEVDRERPQRVLPDLLQRFEHGELLAEGRHPLLIHRHDCEVADQWSFIEIPSHAEAARECLVMERAADVPALSATMTNPLRSVHAEIRKPLFVLDEATIATSVHRSGDEIGVIHRLCSATEEHAVVVERFVDQKS